MELGRQKMPICLKAFILMYIGGYGFMHYNGWITEENILYNVLTLVATVLCTTVFAYGVICLVEDFRKGGIKEVASRLKRFLHG